MDNSNDDKVESIDQLTRMIATDLYVINLASNIMVGHARLSPNDLAMVHSISTQGEDAPFDDQSDLVAGLRHAYPGRIEVEGEELLAAADRISASLVNTIRRHTRGGALHWNRQAGGWFVSGGDSSLLRTGWLDNSIIAQPLEAAMYRNSNVPGLITYVAPELQQQVVEHGGVTVVMGATMSGKSTMINNRIVGELMAKREGDGSVGVRHVTFGERVEQQNTYLVSSYASLFLAIGWAIRNTVQKGKPFYIIIDSLRDMMYMRSDSTGEGGFNQRVYMDLSFLDTLLWSIGSHAVVVINPHIGDLSKPDAVRRYMDIDNSMRASVTNVVAMTNGIDGASIGSYSWAAQGTGVRGGARLNGQSASDAQVSSDGVPGMMMRGDANIGDMVTRDSAKNLDFEDISNMGDSSVSRDAKDANEERTQALYGDIDNYWSE